MFKMKYKVMISLIIFILLFFVTGCFVTRIIIVEQPPMVFPGLQIFNASSITNMTGTNTSGNISSIQNFLDGLTYNITEVTGAPALDLRVNFTNVTLFDIVGIRGFFVSSAGHILDIQLFRWTTNSWEDFGDITAQETFGVDSEVIFNSSQFINNSLMDGLVMLRLFHGDTGIPGHTYSLDFVGLAKI